MRQEGGDINNKQRRTKALINTEDRDTDIFQQKWTSVFDSKKESV